MKIRAILIDSGRVLNGPRTGHWFITPNFFDYVDKKKFNSLSKTKLSTAFSKSAEYISRQKLIENEEDEYKHFLEYYRIFFKWLPELTVEDEKIHSVTKDLVYNYDKYKFYDEIYDLLPSLSCKYKLALVSDAWPSLENVYVKAGLRDYFSSFIISSILGVTKPNKLMYETALNDLNVLPEEAIFIDDNIRNCDGARKIGIQTALLCRDIKSYIYYKLTCKDHIVIKSLTNILRKIS